MRKVKFNKWVPTEWKNVENGNTLHSTTNPGLKDNSIKWTFFKGGYWETDFINDGLFHSFGFESQDNGEQMVMDSMAIIESPDGSVQMVSPSKIKFVD